jgi:hypothetical protein
MPHSSEILAHWRYEPDLWRDFAEYESRVYRKSVRSALHFIYGTVTGAAVLIALVALVPLFVTGKWNSSIWGPAFGIGVVAAIFLAIGVVVWWMRREKMARFRAETGEAVITLHDIDVNGAGFSWGYGDTGWRLIGAGRKSIDATPLKRIQVLELKFITRIPAHPAPIEDLAEWRVPIQSGKEPEADRVIEHLMAKLAATK